MGRCKGRRWYSCLIGVFASVVALLSSRVWGELEAGASGGPDPRTRDGGRCPLPLETTRDKFFLLISTLDGRVTALDLHDNGNPVWSHQADVRPLLSSSIGHLEINRDGSRTRVIPSLDGGLYQFDGESVEAIPMSAESLLSSSTLFGEDTMMVGAKDKKTYGIDVSTGELRYVCSMAGCQYRGSKEISEDNVLVLTRTTQTVRAVDARSGLEKWNFSVGQHQIQIFEKAKPENLDHLEGDTNEDDEVNIISCPDSEEILDSEKDNQPINREDFADMLKVVVPEGVVVALNPDDPSRVMWQHKFSSPVANAWLVRRGAIKQLNLFNDRHVPALSSYQQEGSDLPSESLLYVGLHQTQLYVQPSQDITEKIAAAASAAHAKSDANRALVVPKVVWRPYLNTAPSRTPILNAKRPSDLPMLDFEDASGGNGEKSLTVWHENYPFDNGYYLYPDFSPGLSLAMCEDKENISAKTSKTFLWNTITGWWKEGSVSVIFLTVMIHVLISRYIQRKTQTSTELPIAAHSNSTNNSTLTRTSSSNFDLTEAAKPTSEFVSRFSTEFETVHCLGKGGFGVVFEARNKMDDCNYAVKRIAVPNKDDARDRMMREVKALAKLDHAGIVRYFHAWMESPPPGWQEERDKDFEDSECFTPTPCNSGEEKSLTEFTQNGLIGPSVSQRPQPARAGLPLNLFLEENMLDLSEKEGVTRSFSPRDSCDSDSTDESGSFSLGVEGELGGQEISTADDSSFCIEFQNGDEESMNQSNSAESSKGGNLPFQQYLKENTNTNNDSDSYSIVFEDSGCRDRGSNGSFPERNKENKSDSGTGTPDDHVVQIDLSSNKTQCCSGVVAQDKEAKLYLYIQMQLCRRETLKDWLSANTLRRDQLVVLDIFDQIVSAVEYVHNQGLMHRDLKPSNIFFSLDGEIKIGDFGLVTALSEQQDRESGNAGGATAKHTADVGTQLYMSPEQISKKPYDFKVDIFSLGMILFELTICFETQMERIRTLQDAKRGIFPSKFCEEDPARYSFVKLLLSLDPAERPTATQILDSTLLKDFAPRRMIKRFRSRTISSCSSSSDNLK